MKKIFVLLFVAFAAVSCLDKGSYSQSYMADITFEFSETAYKESFKDSIFVMDQGEAFLYMQYPLFFPQKYSNGVINGGFTMSILKGEKDGALTREPMPNDAFRVNAESGQNGSKTYAVYYDNPIASEMPSHGIEFGYKNNGYMTPNGLYVNNSTLVARKIKEHFQDGDKLVLKVIGVKSVGPSVETSIKLAEFTEAKDSIMYNWTPLSLSTFGIVDYIDFKVESTNPEVPGYFCLDGVLANIYVEY
jgi:hypothetical protein